MIHGGGMAVSKCSEGCSERFLQLNVEDKMHYIVKLSLINGIDHMFKIKSADIATLCLMES